MKRVEFQASPTTWKQLCDLTVKLGVSVAAVIREAIRLLHKKEIK